MTSDSQPQQISKEQRRHLDVVLAISAVSILLLATIIYHYVEDWSWVDSFYFSAIAASTVGFGDIAPDTDGAKLFTVFYVFAAVSIIATWLNERMRRHGLKLIRGSEQDDADED